MNLSRIRDDLHHFLSNGLQRQREPFAQLDELIETLKRKDVELQQRLAAETDPLKRRHLKIELKVTRMQHDKGLARRLELQSQLP